MSDLSRFRLNNFLPFPWLVAWRYLRGRRSELLSSTALAALIATTLGVTAMVVAMALMTGYTEDLQRKLIGLQGEIIASPLGKDAFEQHGEAIAEVSALPGVVRVGRSAYGEGSLSSSVLKDGVGVILRGVDPASDPTVTDPALLLPDDQGVASILVGEELRRRLGAEVGEVLRLVVLELGERAPRFRYRSVRLRGTFSSGFAQFDSSWVLLDRATLEQIRGDSSLEILELKLADPALTAPMTAQIEEILGSAFVVNSWQRLNRELFAALELQELLLFLVLGLIVVVSTFNVASTLVILVRERTRDIGVLGALGLGPGQLWWIFATYGLLLGAVGTTLGVLVGAAIAWTMTTFELVSFGPEIAAIYFIDSVPFRVEWLDVVAVAGFSLAVTLIACSLPAFRAARIRPSQALRADIV